MYFTILILDSINRLNLKLRDLKYNGESSQNTIMLNRAIDGEDY